jgi:hypothetical protein
MDEITKNLALDARVSLTLTEASTANGCGSTDPEDPTCARASFLGVARRLADGAGGADAAKRALFAKHPAMAGWPDDHSFAAYEVVVREAHLLDYYGGMAVIAGGDYYAVVTPPDEATTLPTPPPSGLAVAAT